MSKQHGRSFTRVTKGAATKAKEDAAKGKMAKGKSSQVVQRAAGSGGNRQSREERRQ